jgi:hypothetical protein
VTAGVGSSTPTTPEPNIAPPAAGMSSYNAQLSGISTYETDRTS